MSALYEESKLAARYVSDKGNELLGRSNESKMIESQDEFLQEANEEYIPLQEADLHSSMNEQFCLAQPKDLTPSEQSSATSISYKNFRPPSPLQKKIFKNIQFNTDSYSVNNDQEEKKLEQIVKYLKTHKNTYLFIEGHCDQRGDGKYNLALGTKRANSIRSHLIKKGIHPKFIYTVSYGKDKLLNPANTPAAWAENRRSSFKLLHQGL